MRQCALVLLAAGGGAALEEQAAQEADAPRLPEGNVLQAEDVGHEPVPEEVGRDGVQKPCQSDDDRQTDGNHHTDEDLLHEVAHCFSSLTGVKPRP